MDTKTSHTIKRRKREEGIALIIVIGFIAMLMTVGAMMVASSRVSRVQGAVAAERSRARYIAESAASYAAWMLICDRRRFRNRRLGERGLDQLDRAEDDVPWMTDGKQHEIQLTDDTSARIRLFDADRGWILSGNLPSRNLRNKPHFLKMMENDNSDRLNTLFDCLDDYTDSDDLVRVNGRERDDYQREDGLECFPRNHAMQFREEAYWIPGIEQLVPSLSKPSYTLALPEDAVRLIPPRGVRFAAKPSFFSSSPEMIMATAGLTYDELQLALTARTNWYHNGEPIQNGLGEVFAKISNTMSMVESGIATIDVEAGANGSEIRRRLVITLDIRNLTPRGRPPVLMLWQRLIF